MPKLEVYQCDNLEMLKQMKDCYVDLIYIDPPFNTGKKRTFDRRKCRQNDHGKREGFAGKRYDEKIISSYSYEDNFSDFIGFIRPRLEHAHRVLKDDGSLFFHIDPRESHYCKILLDKIFGRDCFMNEIIWSYDFGGRTKKRWPAKHNTIFWYAKDPDNYCFNYSSIDRIPYLAPGLVGKEKAARGKTPTDVWWHTIVPTNGRERTGYPTQKPLGILKRIIKVHSDADDLVLDFFAGSGTTGSAAYELGRNCILIDNNPSAIEVMKKRFQKLSAVFG